jgi:hypothetical protein
MGSFRWIAELFELDVQAVRKRLFSGARIALDTSFEESAPEVSSVLDASSSDIEPATLQDTPPLEVMVAAA